MLFTLHRYIFWELLKVSVLTIVALALILSLGSILRPVQEYGVGPQRVLNLIGYFLPIALTFILPIAALFAASLVYGRLAGDNELDACKASGISLLTLVYPALILAIIVAIANLILSFHVMPYFVHLAEKSLKADAKQILFRNIQRKGYYGVPPDEQYLIYADHADPQNNTLSGVVILKTEGGGIEKIITAESAKVDFFPHERFNEGQITAYKTYQMGPEDELWFEWEWMSLRVEFGSLLGDDIKFKKHDEMRRVQNDLMCFDPVAKLAQQVYAQFTAELLAQDIADKTANDPNSFYELLGKPNSVKFTAAQAHAQDEEKVDLSGEVTVVEYDTNSKQPLLTLRSTKVSLYIEGDKLAPTLTMDIYNSYVNSSEDLKMRHIIHGLILPKSVTDNFKTGNVLQDIRPQVVSSALKKGPSPRLKDLQNKLQIRIQQTLAEIEAEIHSRLVFGIGCVPMILIGLGLGIIKKGGHLLTAFAASCVPATVLIVCIISGKHITENLSAQSISGITLMWVGLGLLVALVVIIYRNLLKN